MLGIIYQVVEQLFTKKSTNLFPAKYAPESVKDFLAAGKINPPIPVPDNFRGKLLYDYDKCIGCAMCVKVCPANVIELYPVIAKEKKSKRITLKMSRCTFCSECVDICPTDALDMSQIFTMAARDKYCDALVVGIEEKRLNETAEEPKV